MLFPFLPSYPRPEIHPLPRLGKPLIQSVNPIPHPRVNQRLHLFDVGEAVRRGRHFAEPRVRLCVLYVEQALHLAEAARDVVFRLVGLAVVELG